MSGPYEYPMGIPPLDNYDPNFPIYDQQYGVFQRMSAPATPQEGFGFWYRPEPSETVYRHDSSIYNRSLPPLPPTNITMTESSQTKHRRTRSGCFTCRSRRVKCDETRPVCDRCRKGNRDCEFPQNASSSKRSKPSETKSGTGETALDDRLDTIKDESEDDDDLEEEEDPQPSQNSHPQKPPDMSRIRTQSNTGASRPQRPRQQSTTSAKASDYPGTPSTEGSFNETPLSPHISEAVADRSAQWKQLKPDLEPEMEKYLRFQLEHMTHYHYLFKIDPEDFVHIELIDTALRFQPLLYAVVAFVAYHHTIRLPDSDDKFDVFWEYYSRSIRLLRKHLESTEERSDEVLLTVLQLATFEEYMGDWTNLTSHHKAAYGILTSRYTPAAIMTTDRGRKMFDWYVRLDVISGLMAVKDVKLDRSWIEYVVKWHEDRSSLDGPNKLLNKLEYFGKLIEKIGQDIAHTFAEGNELFEQGRLTITDVIAKTSELERRLDHLREQIQSLNNPAMSCVDYGTPRKDDDVFDPKIPLFRDDLWLLNFIWIDWYGILILLKHQTVLAIHKANFMLGQDPDQAVESPQSPQAQMPAFPPELTKLAQTQCEIFNAINSASSAPAGATLVCYAALGVSAVFLPKSPPASNERFTTWARKQIANIELQGYVWPPHFRKQMAQIWQDPTVLEWWLPNGEGKKRILTKIREIVEDRIAATTNSGKDDGRNDLREIRGIFESMDLNSTRRRSSATLDSINARSNAGSTPEDLSSGGSVAGFSPRSHAEREVRKQRNRGRKSNQAGAGESPLLQTNSSTASNRMSGIWEEQT